MGGLMEQALAIAIGTMLIAFLLGSRLIKH
ncbi:MAG: hypothetical protein JWP01_1468 [Myxococcales bacterium]|nr:hypothetical protein [Myxococcales bacterium]